MTMSYARCRPRLWERLGLILRTAFQLLCIGFGASQLKLALTLTKERFSFFPRSTDAVEALNIWPSASARGPSQSGAQAILLLIIYYVLMAVRWNQKTCWKACVRCAAWLRPFMLWMLMQPVMVVAVGPAAPAQTQGKTVVPTWQYDMEVIKHLEQRMPTVAGSGSACVSAYRVARPRPAASTQQAQPTVCPSNWGCGSGCFAYFLASQGLVNADVIKRWILTDGREDTERAPGFLDLSLSRLGQLLKEHGPNGLKALTVARFVVENSEMELVKYGTQHFLRLRNDPGLEKGAGGHSGSIINNENGERQPFEDCFALAVRGFLISASPLSFKRKRARPLGCSCL